MPTRIMADRKGVSAIEYGLLAALIALAALVAITMTGRSLKGTFTTIGSSMQAQSAGADPYASFSVTACTAGNTANFNNGTFNFSMTSPSACPPTNAAFTVISTGYLPASLKMPGINGWSSGSFTLSSGDDVWIMNPAQNGGRDMQIAAPPGSSDFTGLENMCTSNGGTISGPSAWSSTLDQVSCSGMPNFNYQSYTQNFKGVD